MYLIFPYSGWKTIGHRLDCGKYNSCSPLATQSKYNVEVDIEKWEIICLLLALLIVTMSIASS